MNKHEIHAGYEFESGMFSRMRSWVDVASWVRLLRVPRVLASPGHVGLILIACFVSRLLVGWDLTGRMGNAQPWEIPSVLAAMIAEFLNTAGWRRVAPTALFLIVIWVPVIQLVCRGGAALAAGKPLPAVGHSLPMVTPRLWRSLLVVVVPWVVVLALMMLVFGIRIPGLPLHSLHSQWLSWLIGCLVGVASIPIGVLGFGALFAIPLGLAAMVIEKDPDPIDSLSRGYEYLFRRPLQLVWYVVVSMALVSLAGWLLSGVGWAASVASQCITSVAITDGLQRDAALGMIAMIVCAWQCTLAFALLGGIYLLLRSDAGGQEAEDFWIPAAAPSLKLPELPKEALES